MSDRLAERVVIVTGGGRGIGKGIAARLAREGGHIVIAELNEESGAATAADIQRTGGRAEFRQIDIGSVDAVRALCAEVADAHGKIDVLVNNAGGTVGLPMYETTEEMFRREFEINVLGLYFLSEAVSKVMAAAERGRIINIASITGQGYPTLSPGYAAAKGAAIALTLYLAGRLSEFNINVNAVCPGAVHSGEHWEEVQSKKAAREGVSLDEKIAQISNQNPLRRVNSSDDIASAVLFLASDDAANVTGQILDIDGGRRALSGWMVLRALQGTH